MQVELDTSYKLFRDIPCNSVFIWNINGRVYVKTDSSSAINLDKQAKERFYAEDVVIPCAISRIVLRK